MGQRTYPQLPNGKILSWIDLLDKYNIEHIEGASAHIEWDSAVRYNKKLPKVKVVYKDDSGKDTNNENEEEISLRITKRHRDFVWKRDIGNSKIGKCYVCDCTITDDNFEAGHIIAKAKGGTNDVSNLRSICIPCNKSIGTQNLEDFKKENFGSLYNNRINKISTKMYSKLLSKNEIIEDRNNQITEWENSIRLLKDLRSKVNNGYKDALTIAIENLQLNIDNQ